MSVVVVGLSHRTAPLEVLERASLDAERSRELESTLCRGEHLAEAAVLSTCNRLEVYAEVSTFHGGVGSIGTALADVTGVPVDELAEHLYVHYEGSCVRHLFEVACGLDSMAVGEAQILGQVRTALRGAQESGSAGRVIGQLLQNALRVGKRAHSETRLDRAGPSLVEAGLEHAERLVGPLADAALLVIGAGAMSGLAVASAVRAGAGSIAVSSRTEGKAARLAAGAGGVAVPIAELDRALAGVDVVVACAGARGLLVTEQAVAAALAARAGRPQVYIDLALPRDVDPRVARLPGASVLDLESLGRDLAAHGLDEDIADVRALVGAEIDNYQAARRAAAVAPTVVALRAMARGVVESELSRLESRLDGVDERVRAELVQTVHRVVEKLLHTPTVRIKELAGAPGGDAYADALRSLFDLDTALFDADRERLAAISSPLGPLAPGGAA
jgi:glutamyl-tRNA reductase